MCPRQSWFVVGSDDFQLRVFNYDMHEKDSAFAVQSTLAIIFACCDDMTIKARDWDKQ